MAPHSEQEFDPLGLYLISVAGYDFRGSVGQFEKISRDNRTFTAYADDSHTSALRQLIHAIVEDDSFRGTLFLTLAKGIEDRAYFKLARRLADIYILAAEIRENKGASLVFPLIVDEALALGYLACCCGGSAVIVAPEPASEAHLHSMHNPARNRRINGCHFKVALAGKELLLQDGDSWSLDQAYLDALTLRRRMGAGRARLGFQSYSLPDFEHDSRRSAPFGYWSFHPDGECRRWIDHLFLRRTDRVLFASLCEKVAQEVFTGGSDELHGKTCQIKATLLCALRIALKLSEKNVEGKPIESNFYLPFGDVSLERFTDVFTPLVHPKKPLKLDFDYLQDIDRLVELADSRELMIVACPRARDVKGVYQCKETWHDDLHRQQILERAVTQFDPIEPAHEPNGDGEEKGNDDIEPKSGPFHGIVINFRYQGKVELYCSIPLDDKHKKGPRQSKNKPRRLYFYKNGFEWGDPSLYSLETVIEKSCSDMDQEGKKKLAAALLISSESTQSSIVTFVSKDDQDHFEKQLEGKELFEHSRGDTIVSEPSCKAMTVESLRTFLSADGAHFIYPDGTLKAIGLRVLQPVEDSDSDSQGGTGRAAVRVLRQNFPNSKVIKVSASGGIEI